jgi:hypothetical protein
MKKIITFLILVFAVTAANAQGTDSMRPEQVRIVASIFTVALFMLFILQILKRVLDYRLKNKIVDKGIPESIASSILQTETIGEKEINIKWFALLAGTGVGLIIVNYTQPLGIHSLAIMALSVSASFLGYYFFLILSRKK